MDYDGITVRKDTGVDHVAEIVLDRPDALNALNTAMAESIADIIVADENAVFGLPEVTVGLVPGGAARSWR